MYFIGKYYHSKHNFWHMHYCFLKGSFMNNKILTKRTWGAKGTFKKIG
jgi:hypothetical protein